MRILGPLEVEDESGQAVELGSPKQQALLALLAIHPNSVLSTDRIIDELWGDQPPSDGARNVRVYISRLREVLEPDRAKRAPGRLIVTEPTGYALRIDAEDIDALRFERLVGEARGEMVDDPESARRTITEALGLWRDRPLAGLAFEEFARSDIRPLEELHLSALELRHEASIWVGEHSSTIPDLEKLVAEHPLRERLVALLMEALAGSGRQAEALRVYRSLELRLASEVGLEPSVELRSLEERILLRQERRSEEPSLRAPRAKPVGHLPSVRGYELREEIGAGTFGVVYRAYQASVGREVAIKVIRPWYADNPEFIRRFESEAQLVARLEHPHIVPLYDFWREADGAYLAMRWMRAGSLAGTLRRGPWSVEAAGRLLEQVGAALRTARACQVFCVRLWFMLSGRGVRGR